LKKKKKSSGAMGKKEEEVVQTASAIREDLRAHARQRLFKRSK